MKNKIRYQVLGLLSVIICESCQEKKIKYELAAEKIQTSQITIPPYHPTNQALYDTIMTLDNEMWKAYNSGDLAAFEKMITENHEFYHDRGGLTKSKEENVKLIKEEFNGRPGKIKGGSLDGHYEVYEIPGYGALQVGYQQFFTEDFPEGTSPSRTITLWKETEDGWKQEYVFSMHAHPADNFEYLEIIDAATSKKILMKEKFKYDFLNNIMKSKPLDTSNVTHTYEIIINHYNKDIDTVFSTGTLFEINNGSWLQASEDLIEKYRE